MYKLPTPIRSLVLYTLFFTSFLSAPYSANAQFNRDILLGIVNQCLDSSVPGYCSNCSTPVTSSECRPHAKCTESIEIWALNPNFTAIRDIKMCGCPSTFVHGLALPRARVSGVEDPNKPSAIWQFAWEAVVSKIPESELALIVNPQNHRSQDQLHIHLLRFKPELKVAMLEHLAGNTGDLRQVWEIAENYAKSNNLSDYGVTVIRSDENHFYVLVNTDSPEYLYGIYKCH